MDNAKHKCSSIWYQNKNVIHFICGVELMWLAVFFKDQQIKKLCTILITQLDTS